MAGEESRIRLPKTYLTQDSEIRNQPINFPIYSYSSSEIPEMKIEYRQSDQKDCNNYFPQVDFLDP